MKLFDMATERIGWVRLELPTGSVWAIIVSSVIFYFVSTFIGYWQHRLMHWRWFWQLHRFHHATPDFNILSNFRANPAEAITVLPGMGTLFFLKVPDASLFATFLLFGQVVATFQHSQLPLESRLVWPLAHRVADKPSGSSLDRPGTSSTEFQHRCGIACSAPGIEAAIGRPLTAFRAASIWIGR